jgi:hypothetical protein
MKFTIIHPTKNRPLISYNTFCNWKDKAWNWAGIEYILSVDHDDLSNYNWNYSPEANFTILRKNNKSAIEAINSAAEISTGEIIIVISDDFDCPQNWDILLYEELKNKSKFCLKTDDGLQPTLITLPIMHRGFYDCFGYVYYPGYTHLFSDQEMTAVALMSGRYLKSNISFPHNHYTTGKSQKDAINIKNDSTWQQGEALFNERLKTNFGIENPVIPYSEIKWK